MVGVRYGMAGNGLKWQKNQDKPGDPRWPHPPLRRPDPGASDGGWLGKFYRRDCPEVAHLPGRRVLQVAGR